MDTANQVRESGATCSGWLVIAVAMIVFVSSSGLGAVTPVQTAQQAYLKASNTGATDRFGHAVAVSGDTVVVGAIMEDSNGTSQTNNAASNSGAVYVFVRNGTNWTQQAYLKASNTGGGDVFGISVSISGNTIVVGARNEASSATGVNGNQADNSADHSGAAYVFVRNGTVWIQQAYLKASNTGAFGDEFGYSVSVSGDTIVVGAPYEASVATGVNGNQSDNSANEAGAAYVFVRNGTVWSQQAYLKASNTGAGDLFGYSVAVDEATIVVGAYQEDSSSIGVNGNQTDQIAAGNSGAAYVFTRNGTNWSQQAYLKASNTEPDDRFGWSVAVSADTVVIGAHTEDSNTTGINGNQNDNSAGNSGAAYVFVRSETNWTQQAYIKASNTGGIGLSGDFFGRSVSITDDTLVIGADAEDSNTTGVDGNQTDNSAVNAGAAYVFVRNGTNWSQQAYLKASNTGAGDEFGWSVAVSDGTVIVGAFGERSNSIGVNVNQADNSFVEAGAVYIFTGLGPPVPELAILRSGTSVLLSWFTNTLGFTLQSTTNLNPTTAWVDSTNLPVIVGGRFTVTNVATNGMEFYRLKK